MTNGEKFKDEIWRIACDGSNIAIKDGELCKCNDITCNECSFLHNSDECEEHIKEWCKSEYVEYETDWSKVPVDTKVMVRYGNSKEWVNRHFCKFENGKVFTFNDGRTTFTSNGYSSGWSYVKLADKDDEIKYRKRVE